MALVNLNNGSGSLDQWMTAAEAAPIIDDMQLWPAIYDAMEDDIRDHVHDLIAPCSDAEFLEKYLDIAENDLIIG